MKVGARGTSIQRFWSKTVVEGDCIVWTAGLWDRRPGKGYGVFYADGAHHRAHRWIYERSVGPAALIMHSCDNPRCVKLQHLSPGTDATNAADAVAKGRNIFGSSHPRAKLTEREVDDIRSRYGPGITQQQLASEFAVSTTHISRIVNGKQRLRRKEK